MRRRDGFLPAFFVAVFLCILILVLSLSGKLNFLSSFLEKGTSGIQSVTFGFFQKLPFISESAKISKLEETNLELLSRIAAFEKLRKENQALSDQFQTSYPQGAQLLKADVVGAASFVPGVSDPNSFIINKGLKDNLKVGSAVVIKDNLVGVISQVSANLARVNAINNPLSYISAKTQNGAIGIVRGGANLTLDSILLSENIREGELVLTKGDINSAGVGIPPDLVIGEITFVGKNPSDLFQKAEVGSFVNFTNLSSVFVYMQTN